MNNWCVLPWRRLYQPLSVFLNCQYFFLQDWVLMGFAPSSLAYLLLFFLFASCVGSLVGNISLVLLLMLVGDMISQHSPWSLALIVFPCLLLKWSLNLRYGNILQIQLLELDFTALYFYWLWAFFFPVKVTVCCKEWFFLRVLRNTLTFENKEKWNVYTVGSEYTGLVKRWL